MIKIRFIKDYDNKKIGDIVNCSKKSAESAISQGYAEYIKEISKEKKKKYSKAYKILEKEGAIEKKEKSSYFIFEKEGQAIQFIKKQPLFYDRSDMWWLWSKEKLKWEITDRTDILNGIKKLGVNTITSKDKTEIINALQQVGRENMPKEIPKEYVQFKNRIINIKTGEEFEPDPKRFSTNPIPWNVGDSEETPTMDKYFKEWVGKKYVDTLYEIIAYSSCSEQFMQRMIALVGGGANGKGTYIKVIKKFLGKGNTSTSELALLSTNQFETSTIYKKLLCEMGEVSYEDLKSTNQIKKLSGEDDIRYCFKGKTPFTEESPTTCIINTNSLPNTPDKTLGFYRRWLIVDFPNQFPIKSGILESIPDSEFDNLARKSIRILKEMYEKQEFTNEGDYQERAKRYEERSNPVMKFIEEYCDEDIEKYISLKKFSTALNDYLISKHLRKISPKEIKKKLGEEGFEVSRTTKNYVRDFYISNLNLKIIPIIPIIHKNPTQPLHGNLVQINGINGINGINEIKLKEPCEKCGSLTKNNHRNMPFCEECYGGLEECQK